MTDGEGVKRKNDDKIGCSGWKNGWKDTMKVWRGWKEAEDEGGLQREVWTMEEVGVCGGERKSEKGSEGDGTIVLKVKVERDTRGR